MFDRVEMMKVCGIKNGRARVRGSGGWSAHVLALTGLAALGGEAVAAGTGPLDRPNVLFIAVDDLGNTLGCCGDPTARTPHIDGLARRGVLFTRAYCQIPLCNPSRASVLTGQRPDQLGVYDLDRHFRAAHPDVVTLPQRFGQHGWFTARVGKVFHADVPRGIGTDGLDDSPSWQQVVNPQGRDVEDDARVFSAEPRRPTSAALSWLAADGPDEAQTDGLVAIEAIRLMRAHRDEPFFLAVGFYRPHTPFIAPRAYFDRYPLEALALPAAPADDRDDIPPAAFAHNNAVPNYGLREDLLRQARRAYLAAVSFVDAQVGRLLAAVEELGLDDRTIVVLWSDHGYHLGEHGGIWQKRTLFEEATRAPLIVLAPGRVGNGQVCRRVVEFVDLLPTVAALAGVPVPDAAELAGRSLTPLLDDPGTAWDEVAVSQILRPADERLPTPVMGRSVRTARWRYTEWNGGGHGRELYDHAHDPEEFHNLAAEAATEQATRETEQVMAGLRQLLEPRARPLPPAEPFNPARL